MLGCMDDVCWVVLVTSVALFLPCSVSIRLAAGVCFQMSTQPYQHFK